MGMSKYDIEIDLRIARAPVMRSWSMVALTNAC
jgi:hypothetical protein